MEFDDSEIESGIGGWLILVCINVVFNSFLFVGTFFLKYLPLFFNGYLRFVLTSTSELYNPTFALILYSDMIVHFSFACASLYLSFLFLLTKKYFPKFFIIFHLSLLFVGVIHVIIIIFYFPFDVEIENFMSSMKPFILTLFPTIFGWIPYMLLSKRVKLTFID